MSSYTNPTVAEFKTNYQRDFPFGTDIATSITDADIGKAFQQTNVTINECLFGSQESYTIGYLLLAAHFLVVNITTASQGINGQQDWLVNSKSVGNVSAAYSIPDNILKNPYFVGFTTDRYGWQYLWMVYPNLTAPIMWTYGRTLP